MRCPRLAELPLPPPDKIGWPWTEESPQLSDTMPDGQPWPRISIVTPSYNQGHFIEETIRSVLLQGYLGLEYIIIDGGSTDGSPALIQRYAPWLTYRVSEPDRGQSDAINKGFRKASGRILAWLNADDLYEPGAVSAAARTLNDHADAVMVYGDCSNIDAEGKAFSLSRSRVFDRDRLIHHWPNFIPQPTVFFRRSAFEAIESLDVSLQYAMDYDLWIRLGTQGSAVYLPRTLARFRVHPDSKTSGGPATYWPEIRLVSRRHGGGFCSPMYITHLRDRAYLFRQALKRRLFR
jgi:glycosyltransferase involved in cell wall biosynthesis